MTSGVGAAATLASLIASIAALLGALSKGGIIGNTDGMTPTEANVTTEAGRLAEERSRI
jgi:hypothetical protein